MIKFLDLSGILNQSQNAFVFYNKETHHFLSFFNRAIWYSFEDFESFLNNEKGKNSELSIEEYRKLIPVEYLHLYQN